MLRKIDCVMLYVADIPAAADYYARVFGMRISWRRDHAIGLCFPETDAELVLHDDPDMPSPSEPHSWWMMWSPPSSSLSARAAR